MLTGINELNNKIKELVEGKATDVWTENIKDALESETEDMENAVSEVKYEDGSIKITLKEGLKVANEYQTNRGVIKGQRQNLEGALEGEGTAVSDKNGNYKWINSIRDRK